MSEFGDVDYWNYRYSSEEGIRYEWLEKFQTLKALLYPCMTKQKQTKILNIGCGNSQIQDQLYQEGYHSITSNDISGVVIKQLKLSSKYPQLVYDVMDVTEMTYPDKSFDLVIDKSTIDSLMCSDTPYINVAKMLYHCHRVLADDGIYFALSYAKPSQRMRHFKRQHINFEITMTQVKQQGKDTHYVYIGKKIPMQYDPKKLEQVLKQVEEEEQKQLDKKQ